MHSVKLPLHFDVEALQTDLARIGPAEWSRHYASDDYEGEWSGVALRTVGGMPGLFPMMAPPELFAPTAVLLRCPYFQQVITEIRFPLTAVRLLKLDAGSRILEHHDDRVGFADGQVRLHIPIVTHPAVDFRLEGEPVVMREGECWYLDLTRNHRCDNRSDIDRVHLVLDGVANDWIASYLTS